jgi:hypothetical protein
VVSKSRHRQQRHQTKGRHQYPQGPTDHRLHRLSFLIGTALMRNTRSPSRSI